MADGNDGSGHNIIAASGFAAPRVVEKTKS